MLAISEEFLSYQGEGTLTGTRMYFVRTQGCSVECYFCDTKYTWKKFEQTTHESDIVQRAKQSGVEWICITGGEPLEQDLTDFVRLLHEQNFRVQIETSGMVYHDILLEMDLVVVSPKNLFSKMKFDNHVLQYAHEIKCVVTKESDIDFYMKEFAEFKGTKIFQPVDNTPIIADMILRKEGIEKWLLMGQQHKMFELR